MLRRHRHGHVRERRHHGNNSKATLPRAQKNNDFTLRKSLDISL